MEKDKIYCLTGNKYFTYLVLWKLHILKRLDSYKMHTFNKKDLENVKTTTTTKKTKNQNKHHSSISVLICIVFKGCLLRHGLHFVILLPQHLWVLGLWARATNTDALNPKYFVLHWLT